MGKQHTGTPRVAHAREQQTGFMRAAEVFRVMSAPMRLEIIHHLRTGERNVSELLDSIATTQSNMSQHLSSLHRAGLLSRRRAGVHIYYSLADRRVATWCLTVCRRIPVSEQGVSPDVLGPVGRIDALKFAGAGGNAG